MIKHKIGNVQDDLCEYCPQMWESECRAYEVPHNEAERKQRESDPTSFCQIPVFRWGFAPGMQLNPKEEN